MVVAAVMFARTGTVLINRPTIESAPATSAGRPETTAPKATSWWPVSHISSCAQAPCSTVLTVVWCERASSPRARVVCSGTRNEATPRCPSPDLSGGPTSVGVSNPANTSRHAAWAASRSRSASQVTNLRYGTGRGQPLPVIAGEYFLQQDRQRPAIEHDVVISQHKPVPVWLRCGSTPPETPAGRRGRRPRRVRRRTPAGSAPRHRRRCRRRPARHTATAATGSAGMICTGSSNCSQKRAARLGCRLTTACTASRRRCGSSGPVTVISSCTAYTSSSWRCAVLA